MYKLSKIMIIVPKKKKQDHDYNVHLAITLTCIEHLREVGLIMSLMYVRF